MARYAAVLAFALLAVAWVDATAASGQECDPVYGCEPTTTTLLPSLLPECIISVDVAVPGQTVELTITNVPDGMTIELLFGGNVVDSGVAGGSPVLGASTAVGPRPKAARAVAAPAGASDGFSDVALSFVVPELSPGSYTLEAVGPAFHCECLPGAGFAVLAAQLTPTTLNNGGGGTGGTGGGSLVRTGTYIGLLLAIAVALLVAGRVLQERAKRTRLAAGVAPRGRHGVDPGTRRSAR